MGTSSTHLLKKMKKKKDWFKLKRYPHIGFPLEEKDRFVWIEKYITNPNKIASHSFLPFIHKTYNQRKFRKKYDAKSGYVIKEACNIQNKKPKALRYSDEKNREIYYAGHLDALVYSYYSFLLSEKYNEKLIKLNLNDCITAYRSIKINPLIEDSSNKCNIDFANEVFNYIKTNKSDKLVVMAFDISSFFDNLKHNHLLKSWMELLEVSKLPNDHFNVFKNITRFSYVDEGELFETFKDKIWFEKHKNFSQEKFKIQKPISKVQFLRNQGAIAYCKPEDFFKHRKKLVHELKHKNPLLPNQKRDYGIPQGSPISSILANLYLLEFDKIINDFVSLNGGLYRRYSDDMITICDENQKEKLQELIISEITKYGLEIQ